MELKIKDYMKIAEAADYLGLCANTLRKWDKLGKLKAVRNPLSTHRLYKKEDLDGLLQSVK